MSQMKRLALALLARNFVDRDVKKMKVSKHGAAFVLPGHPCFADIRGGASCHWMALLLDVWSKSTAPCTSLWLHRWELAWQHALC